MIWITSGDISYVSIAISHHGLAVSSVPLKIELLVFLNVFILQNHYQKHKNSENWSLRFCPSRTILDTKIYINKGYSDWERQTQTEIYFKEYFFDCGAASLKYIRQFGNSYRSLFSSPEVGFLLFSRKS